MKRRRLQIGPYEVRKVLGQGGMAEVLHGYHPLLNRHVAIKRLRRRLPTGANRVELLQRFFLEGKALAQLNHQSLVAVYELVATQDDVYMVLEYVRGFDMSALLRRGPVPPDVVAIIGAAVAGALEHAHVHGIIHRDVKPSNVMVSRRGEVKLMDFGIAKKLKSSDLTMTGIAMGTPLFMAPEVLQGKGADERSDIYSLGALLYQALCGRAPFQHVAYRQLPRLAAEGRYVRVHRRRRGIPRALSRIVDRCLASRPQRRYQTAGEVRKALEVFVGTYSNWSNHGARLVAFLVLRRKISQGDGEAIMGRHNLRRAQNVVLRRHVNPWIVVSFALSAIALTLALLR